MLRPSTLLVLLFITCNAIGQTATEVRARVDSLMQSLDPDLAKEISYSFDDPKRTNWTNLPVGMEPRPGVQYGKLSEKSKVQFHRFLTTVLSSQGYLKTTSIMMLDDILNEVYDEAFKRGWIDEKALGNIKDLEWAFEQYFVAIFGSPDDDAFTLSIGGHHLALSVTVVDDDFTLNPVFFGTDPAEVRITKYAGLRILSNEEDYGFQLINSLNSDQQSEATLSKEVPRDIITNPKGPKRIDDLYGISGKDMTSAQKRIFERLIKEYIFNLEFEKASEEYAKLQKSGLDAYYFAWIGSYEKRSPHYYIINGPEFTIEYDNVGFQDDGNHIHSIWRHKRQDFGEDMLRAHYENQKH